MYIVYIWLHFESYTSRPCLKSRACTVGLGVKSNQDSFPAPLPRGWLLDRCYIFVNVLNKMTDTCININSSCCTSKPTEKILHPATPLPLV